jgi:hypothetical protein
MSRKIAVIWHASFSVAAGVLYFFFVLPRWPELTGGTTHTLGTAMRIVAGALIGLAALPVVFTLLRTRRPELGTPQLALSLRTSSIVLHVLAGVLIVGTAISEIWLSLDSAGRWLFGIYGAAAAIALLGILAFYLAYVAELPPPPPKPLKPKKEKKRRGRRRGKRDETDEAADAESVEETEDADADETDTGSDDGDAPQEPEESTESEDTPAEVTAEAANGSGDGTAEETESQQDGSDQVNGAEESSGRLRNRRGSGKLTLRRRRRSRGGVAVDD